MSTSSLRSSYSFSYSESVVDSFLDHYARAANFICSKLRINPLVFRIRLIKLFMDNQPRWRVTRDALKIIEREDLYCDMRQLTREECLVYLTSIKTLAEDWLIDHEKL